MNVAYPGAQFTAPAASRHTPGRSPRDRFRPAYPEPAKRLPWRDSNADGPLHSPVTLSDSGGTSVARGALSLTIIPQFTAPPQMLPSGAVGQPYSATLSASGGTPPYTWVVVSGTLPAGLVLNSNGTIGSTPTTASRSPFTAKVHGQRRRFAGANSHASVFDHRESITRHWCSNATRRDCERGLCRRAIHGYGRIPPYSWSIASGSLPSGLSMNPLTGLLSGTPTQAGAFPFAVRLSDSGGGSVTSGALSLTIAPLLTALPQVRFRPAPPPVRCIPARRSTPRAAHRRTRGRWSAELCCLPGLSLNSNGTITGTLTIAGATSFTAKVTDSGAGSLAQTATQTLLIAVNPSSLAIIVPTLPAGIVNVTYAGAQFATGSGGTPPYWSLATGSLPSGLSLNPQTGLLSGTPTQAGTFSFSVRLVDSTVIPGTTSAGA